MATIAGAIFGIIWVFAPNRGLISRWRRVSKQRFEIDLGIVLTYIQDEINANRQVTPSNLSNALGWSIDYSKKLSKFTQEKKFVEKDSKGNLILTVLGQKKAKYYSTS